MANQAVSDALVGLMLGHYRVTEKIGVGGMGEVFRAHDQHLDRDVAIKVLPPGTLTDESARKRFHKEALTLSKLNHPNVATIHDFDTQQGVDFLVMEYIPGITLSDKLANRPLPEKEIINLGTQLAEGLSAAHEHGIVHRDLKPGNLRLTDDGRLKILDFGLAKLRLPVSPTAATESLSETQGMAGTLLYMAPEQILGGDLDARTDIHAAGEVLYEMATGQQPFAQVERAQLVGAILHKPPRPSTALNPKLSLELERIIGKCLEKEPEKRYQSAKEVAIDLRRLLTPSGVKVAEVPVAGRKFWKVLVPAALIFAAAAIGATLYFRSRQTTTRLTEKDTIVLSDFDNKTSDSVFDGTLRQGLAVQLEQSPFLSLISEQRIQQTLKLMSQPADARLTPEIARELCQRTQSAAVLDGSIASLGNQYVLGVKAVNCRTGDTLTEVQERATGKEQVLAAMDKAAAKLRENLGESLSTIQKYDTPLEEATTPSLEALQAYTMGWKVWGRGFDNVGALRFFHRAIELDPKLAMGYVVISEAYGNLGEADLAMEYGKKGYELREHVSEPEKFFIETNYHLSVTGNMEKARQVVEVWEKTYPREYPPPTLYAHLLVTLGEYDQALAQAEKANRLIRDSVAHEALVLLRLMYLDRFDEAQSKAEELEKRNLDSTLLRFCSYELAFLKNDSSGMARQVAWSADQPGVEDVLLQEEAETSAYFGRLAKARDFSRKAIASAERAQEKETAATYSAVSALREALFGNADEARQQAGWAMKYSAGHDVQYGAALALAYAGDDKRAQTLTADLRQRFPEDTLVQFNYLPTLRAELALSRRNAPEALETLRPVTPYELGQTTFTMYPVYVRGEAYLAAHQGSEAAAEFQKILDHRGIVLNEPIGALAHLQIGRAYAMAGDTAKARAAYQDFLTLWKDADPGIPILKQAKTEYAKLQ